MIVQDACRATVNVLLPPLWVWGQEYSGKGGELRGAEDGITIGDRSNAGDG